MDRLDIEWSVINVFIVVVLIVGGIVIHELPIAHAAQNNIETNYYLFSDDNMTHTQKYDVALSICQSVYEDEIMKMWLPPRKDTWVENNALKLIKTDGGMNEW